MNRCQIDDVALQSNTTAINASINNTDKLILARGYTAVVTLVISFFFFIFALANLYRKYARFNKECTCCCRFLVDYFTNPFLLLALISLLPVATYWLILIKYPRLGATNRLDEDFCKVPGYLLLWLESSETLALAVFSLYFLFYYIPFHNKLKSAMLQPREYERVAKRNRFVLGRNTGTQQSDVPPEYKARVPKASKLYWCHSITTFLTAVGIVVVCGLYTCPHFVKLAGPSGNDSNNSLNITNTTNKMKATMKFGYGVQGPWCWIKPLAAQKDFWFYEEWVLMGISSIALILALVFLLCVTQSRDAKFRLCKSIKWDKTILVPFSIFFLYFILQFALMVVEILVRICDDNSNNALWFTYAIGKPLAKILLVVAALQLMSTSYRMGRKKEEEERLIPTET